MEVGGEAQADEQGERINRERLKFRNRMKRFEMYSAATQLTVEDVNWPLIAGPPQNKSRLTGRSYVNDRNLHQLNEFTAEKFHALAAIQLYSSGSGYIDNVPITRFVLQRTMKTVVSYCNYMYDLARRNGRNKITRHEVHNLMRRNEYRFYLYFRHFLPNPNPNADTFHNQYSAQLHNHFFTIENMQEFWYSEELKELSRQRANRMIANHMIAFPNERWDVHRNLCSVHFVCPMGTDYSSFYAHRLHEALGMPPLETEIITVLSWLVKNCISETVYKTLKWCDARNIKTLPTVEIYEAAMEHRQDLLFDLAINFRRPSPPPSFHLHDNTPLDVTCYYERIRMRRAIEAYRNHFYEVQYPSTIRTHSVQGANFARRP